MKQITRIYYLLILPSFVVIIFLIKPKKLLTQTFENQTSEISTPATFLVNQQQTETKSNNSFSSDIAGAVLGGFLGWGLTTITSFIIDRNKLQTYLAVAINNHVKQLNENKAWVLKVKEKTIKENHIIDLAALYTKDDLSRLTSVRERCLKLLTEKELVKIENLIQRLNQAETLLDGFCNTLQTYKKDKTTLKISDVEYLNKKIERIISYIDTLPNSEIKKVKELRDDYAGVIEASTLVTESSVIRQQKIVN